MPFLVGTLGSLCGVIAVATTKIWLFIQFDVDGVDS